MVVTTNELSNMTITKQQLIDKYNEVYAADNGVNKTFVELTKDEKVEALLQFVTAISVDLVVTLVPLIKQPFKLIQEVMQQKQ